MFSSLTEALGVDGTLWIQFLIFLFFYPVFSRWLFRPYFHLQNQREKETKERLKQAEKWEKKKQDLEREYETKAQSLNEKFNILYNEGSQKLKEKFSQSRLKGEKVIKEEYKQKKADFFQEMEQAEILMQSEINPLAETALNRLLH